ncbi:ABC transporter ATP-binding protein [Cellulosilyticum ruminicola]|uniref:ABC transporter ATP-binding protein n=1 Tax=Cellulosilyticum ruminicola TaxID=425254 RepID=UPI0006D25C66|nr:ABC transporter ATP-binding protein [Cellulosilyticum ruminicola]
MTNRMTLKHVCKSFYTDEGEVNVLNDINLTLKKGEILVILGPSGSGKSTILNILSKLLAPTSGEIQINGQIGYMFQHDHLLEWRTIMANVLIGLEIQKKLTQENKDRVAQLLQTYGLWEFRNSFPRQLSGGMRQRAALIRTLATSPDILLLDEPFSALDYQTRLMVSDDIYQILKKENKEAILVSHDISEAISMADEICVLSKRPATIKSSHRITLTVEGERTPLSSRKAPEFKDYFDILWKELECHA